MSKPDNPNQQVEQYNQSWSGILATGREDSGDLEASLQFIKKFDLAKTAQILEIGCAIGKLCNELGKRGFIDVMGVDVSEVAIQYGKNQYPHLNLYSYNGIKLNFPDERFDICMSFDVVEHIPDVEGHFQEVLRVLKPSGKYLFQTPNILSNSVIETIKQKGRLTWKRYHPSLQSSFSLRQKLIKAGFKKVEFVKISPLTEYKLLAIPLVLRILVKLIPWTLLPVWLQTNFFVIAEKSGK